MRLPIYEPRIKILQQIMHPQNPKCLKDIWRITHPDLKEYSHEVHTNKQNPSRARLDYALISNNVINKIIQNEMYVSDIDPELHHKMITLEIEIPISRIENKFGKLTNIGIKYEDITDKHIKAYNENIKAQNKCQ